VKFKLILTQLVAVVMACAGLWAQDYEDYEPRSVAGIVTDSSNRPVDGAVVQLKNQRTLEFRSYITQQGGKYHFFRLDANADYELKATHNSVWSGKKKLSLFSSKKQKTINLKLKSP
jgi:Carboxypeptidase regulatory-like domain